MCAKNTGNRELSLSNSCRYRRIPVYSGFKCVVLLQM
jgi:hypothetical protein